MAKLKKYETHGNEIKSGFSIDFVLDEPYFFGKSVANKKEPMNEKETEKIYSQKELDEAVAYYKNAREATVRELASIIAAIGGELILPVDAVEGKYNTVKSHNSWYDGEGNKVYSTKTTGNKLPSPHSIFLKKQSTSNNSVSQKILRLVKKASYE